jgi:hypothetical protein
MFRAESKIHSSLAPRKVQAMTGFSAEQYRALSKLGVHISPQMAADMASQNKLYRNKFGMDSLQATVTQASIGTPIQFLQNWLPGFVFVITGARNIDDFIGIATVGSWEDEQVVQGVLERTGNAIPYGDYQNVPLSSWNTNFVYRTVVRFEQGMMVGNLEAARAGRMNVDDSGMKREAAMMQLEIQRNLVGFNGFNSGSNNTYGFLNDPGLPNYVTVANGVSGSPLWSTKTFLEIAKDIRSAIVSLRTNSQDRIDPEKVDLTLAVSTDAVDWLSTTSDFGISVRDWLKQAYPRVRVVSAPQLNNANGGANVFYLYADRIVDESTDGGAVWIQPVPAKFLVTGVQQLAKGYVEDYTNATAGAMAKRPWAIVRRSGI